MSFVALLASDEILHNFEIVVWKKFLSLFSNFVQTSLSEKKSRLALG